MGIPLTTYENISQRVVATYLRALAEFTCIPQEMSVGASETSQRALYAFFGALYARLFAQPDLFGLSLAPDASIAEIEPNAKDKKQEVKRLMDRPREMISAGLDFLMKAGLQGQIRGEDLILADYSAIVKATKVSKKFLAGLAVIGLTITPEGASTILSNHQFPGMMPALRALSAGCTRYDPPHVGLFMFGRCDLRALQGYQAQAADLYRYICEEDYPQVHQLHEYFTGKNYKVICEIHPTSGWLISYQGDRKIKSTPLFQVQYEDRYARPLRMYIKCASSSRLVDRLSLQSEALQDDFYRRAINCQGEKCNWCQNKKTLGPSKIEYQGMSRKICWFTNGDIHTIDEQTVELIQEYEQMHATLAPEK